jgi:hypothetical protein
MRLGEQLMHLGTKHEPFLYLSAVLIPHFPIELWLTYCMFTFAAGLYVCSIDALFLLRIQPRCPQWHRQSFNGNSAIFDLLYLIPPSWILI